MGENGEEPSVDAVARVREVADYIRVSKQRMLQLQSGVLALREKIRSVWYVARLRRDA